MPMKATRSSALTIFAVFGVGLGLWGTFTTLRNFLVLFGWALIHGADISLFDVFSWFSINVLPYVALCAIGLGSITLKLWAWRWGACILPVYLLCDAILVAIMSRFATLSSGYFSDWMKITLPAILFSIGGVWFLRLPKIREQFESRIGRG